MKNLFKLLVLGLFIFPVDIQSIVSRKDLLDVQHKDYRSRLMKVLALTPSYNNVDIDFNKEMSSQEFGRQLENVVQQIVVERSGTSVQRALADSTAIQVMLDRLNLNADERNLLQQRSKGHTNRLAKYMDELQETTVEKQEWVQDMVERYKKVLDIKQEIKLSDEAWSKIKWRHRVFSKVEEMCIMVTLAYLVWYSKCGKAIRAKVLESVSQYKPVQRAREFMSHHTYITMLSKIVVTFAAGEGWCKIVERAFQKNLVGAISFLIACPVIFCLQ